MKEATERDDNLIHKYWTNVRESIYYETSTVGQFELFLIGSTKQEKKNFKHILY
jgi:hypothetical protein